ncbi:hypothetical protein P3X46_013583 [Hevea brasiliensis]|uniref:non-specific serine/threonine protein kinase n=1 Tax=Hevea brasiliensis TaxID=3981 RepID=A0ABQ9M7W8_HEVBR|nr:L-type lectin-domain containing receptor kinase IX.1 [Hevea brasiliensis]KAJ9174996.1 hypothetical protein P3X46_013583 [Hevea brasiliensis]
MEIHCHCNFHLESVGHLLLDLIFIFCLFTFPFTVQTSTGKTTFNFTTFSTDMPQIKFEGDAYAASQIIELNNNLEDIVPSIGSVGRATYFKPMHLWDKASGNLAEFTTHFSFVIKSRGDIIPADGLTFFLAPNGSRLLPSSGYGKLGIYSDDKYFQANQPKFVAVEFDTWWNINIDPEGVEEHIGIDLNSLTSVKYVNWSQNNIAKGGRNDVSIHYNSSTKNFSVTVRNGFNLYELSHMVDLKDYLPEWVTFGFSAATGYDYFERNQIYMWDFDSTLQLPQNLTNSTGPPSSAIPRERKSRRPLSGVLLGIIGALLALVLVLVLFGFCFKRRKQRSGERLRSTGDDFEEAGPRSFSYEELAIATKNFANERLLGKGGFGMVYLGSLSNGNPDIAVKRMSSEARQGLKEYASEVKTISRLRHRNLVRLIGWCREHQELFIAYEYMPNKSLDFHLFKNTSLFTWEKRYGIALGLASALLYLQEECEQCVLHRDIKSSNVLLDSNFNAKLGDFGLARLVEHGQGSDTTKLIGTYGYIAPEYLESSKATKESDVYSFGIVALEIATGKPAFKGNVTKLVDWVWEQYRSGNIFAAADPQLCQNYVEDEMERLIVVGLACAHPNYSERPSIGKAIDILHFKTPEPDIASYETNVNSFSEFLSLGASGSEARPCQAMTAPN